MPISTAEFSKRAVIFIALALTPILIWRLFDVVLLLTGAVLVAVLLHVVAWPLRKIRLPKAFALAIAGLLILAVIAGVFYLFGSGMGDELQEILRRAEAGQKQITDLLQGSTFGETLLSHVQEGTFSLPDLLERVFRISAGFLAAVVIAIVVGAFIAADPAPLGCEPRRQLKCLNEISNFRKYWITTYCRDVGSASLFRRARRAAWICTPSL